MIAHERERATHLSTGPDTGPLLRTIQRLRHYVVMIGRASVVPLPANVQARLARPLSDVSNAIVDYMRAAAAAVQSGSGVVNIQRVDAALQTYAGEVAAMRSEGLIRGVPVDVAERFFALGFSLEQMRQNLNDLDRCQTDWREKPANARRLARRVRLRLMRMRCSWPSTGRA